MGLEPHTGTGAADLHDVPDLFTDRGFAVRNDDDPTGEVRTIDVMSPYEGGNNSWNTNLRDAANDAAGMDIFFIGGHDSYDRAVIPGDDFSPDDTPGRYTRFGTDHPIAMIVGCHGGLTVPDVDVDGGVDHDMVYDLVHEGASGYIGATGFSYGSPNNLHNCTWGENLIQRFFGELLERDGSRTETIGEAMRIAKRDYVGTGDTDRKTLTEFTVYGIPWQTIRYPDGGGGGALTSMVTEPAAFSLDRAQVIQAADGTYSQNFTVDIADYTVSQEQGYDILSVSGGDLDFSDSYPVLPFIEGYTLTLPFSSTVTNIQVVDSSSSSIGTYNIPIVEARPWSEGGTVYTSTTDINYLYPAELVSSQETSEGLVFHVAPIQHNPTTDETIFYDHLEVRVTYEAPLEVTVTDFSTDRPSYAPSDTINASATVANVGAGDALVTATLAIKDAHGQTVATQSSGSFTVPGGGSHTEPLAWTGALGGGSYEAVLTIFNGTDTVAGASANFNVLAGEITDFTAPDTASDYADFQVNFANYKAESVNVVEDVYIYDAEGLEIAKLPQKTVVIGAASEATTDFSWDTTEVPEGPYSVAVIATVDGIQYGPVVRTFHVDRNVVYLPLVLRSGSTGSGYDWLDATSGGTIVAEGDDTYEYVSLPFSFNFYGNIYNGLYVSSNGYVSFGSGYSTYSNDCIPSTSTPNNAIYAFWDDLQPTGGSNGNVYVKQVDSSTFVVEWYQVKRYGSTDYETFEIVLRNDDSITLQYQSMSNTESATVGVENATGTLAQQYICNGVGTPLTNQLAVRYTAP